MDTPSQFEVPWGWELFGGSVAAELLNPASVVAQAELHNPGSCAICQKQLRKQSCAILRVAQAELRNSGSCASGVAQSWELRRPSFAILVAQSGEVAESDFIP